MSDPSPSTTPDAPSEAGAPLSHREQFRLALFAAFSVGMAAVVVLFIYFNLPESSFRSERGLVLLVTAGMTLWLALVVLQLFQLRRSRHPIITAAAALTSTVVLLVVIFAEVALLLAGSDPNAYNVELDKSAALYFSMTVTTTVGFGDIVARSDLARNVTTLQMFIDLVFLAGAVRVLVFAASSRKSQQAAAASL